MKDWKMKTKTNKKTLFQLWIQPELPNTYYYSISIQSMERMEDENKNKRKKKTLFNLWLQPEPPNTYHSIGIQSMERLEDENKNKQKNTVQSMGST